MKTLNEKLMGVYEKPLAEKIAYNIDKYGKNLVQEEQLVLAGLLGNSALASVNKLPGVTNETVLSGDVATFTPLLLPVIARTYPYLVANQLLGVQPMSMPTGYIYALINRYTGHKKDDNGISPVGNGQIIVFNASDPATIAVGKNVVGETSTAEGKIIHVEKDGVTCLVKLTGSTKFGVENTTTPAGKNIVGIYTNESTFHKILKDYTGAHATGIGEKLAEDMNTIGFGIERKTVEAVSRKLKAEYTLEMYEDLKAQHGILADEHLISLMSNELQTEIDREIIGFVNNAATVVKNPISPCNANKEAGRFEIEQYRMSAIKIDLEARNIALTTRRGAGNILIVSPKMATVLDQIGTYKLASSSANITSNIHYGNVGTFDGRYTVIVDQWAADDYVTVLYKGAGAEDAIGFFCPYIPLGFQKVVNPESGQPGIIGRTRYGLTLTPIEPENYARTFGVDLTGSVLV